MLPLPRVKICCISSLNEAHAALAAGARLLGLVGPMPSGPGVLDDASIRAIVQELPPDAISVLLSSETSVRGVVDHYDRAGRPKALQLVEPFDAEAHDALAEALPGVLRFQVVHVEDSSAIAQALAMAPHADALLLDSGNTRAAVRELGGTGRTHDWTISRRIVEAAPVPVFLAGGLSAENLDLALQQVGPYGVDVCSGVRTEGKLDAEKLRRFVDIAVSVPSEPTSPRA